MKKNGSTLVELMVALSVAGIVLLVAGRLLFDGLETWRIQADRNTALRRAALALETLSEDLAQQPAWPDLTAPVATFSMGSGTVQIAFFTTGSDALEKSVCWYLTGDGPWTLWRYEADADATQAALPANAAKTAVVAALSGSDAAAASAVEAASRLMCRGVRTLELRQPTGTVAPQLLLDMLTAEGLRRVLAGETAASLPTRCEVAASRVAPLPESD